MKRAVLYFTIFLSIFLFMNNVSASTYKQGVVKVASSIYSKAEASSNTRLLNDVGGVISLYSPEAVEVIGESGNYYKIKFLYNGFLYNGFINKNNLNVKEFEIDEEYTKSLIEKGFPSDYASRLSILHAIHPNWTFKASFTGGVEGGMDFMQAVNGEGAVIANNLIDGYNTSLRSTADGAYNNGKWIGLSGSNWFAASKQTIAYYLDPRNFLDESHIFMFENLGYNPETQTEEVVNKIIDQSFMNNPFECLEGVYICPIGKHSFAETFVKAGQDKKVSPVHLATRAIQEQGSGGSVLSLGLGYKGEYVGYYNFFNIGASGKTDEDVIVNGFKYAVGRKWNNQYASIYDGSSMIASNYVAIGQSTLYYQKFNTIVKTYFGHQYMQNVRAPYSEGYNTYVGYYRTYKSQEEWNDAVYDFLIPIYSNMGNETTLDTSGNSDATLKSLEISSCKFSPEFQSSAYNYDCYVPKEIDEVKIKAEPTNALAKVETIESLKLESELNNLNIVVTAANGNTSTYAVNIHRIETDGYSPDEVLNGIGIKTNKNIVSNIEVGSDVSNIVSSIKNKYHFAEISITDESGKEYNEGTVKTGLKVKVTNSGLTNEYNVIIYGDNSGDGVVDIRDLLVLQKHLVKAKLLSDEYLQSSDINKDGTVDIRDLLLIQKYILKQYTISQS